MNRQQPAHLLRSACAIANDQDVLVLGSQSILGSFDEDDLPPEATASQEADLAFLNDPDRDKADQVEAVIGEMSAFHDQNGVYAEGIHVDTATLPEGWRTGLSAGTSSPRTLPSHTSWSRTTWLLPNSPRAARRTRHSSVRCSGPGYSTWR